MSSEPNDYRRRVDACWMGKAVGGTLGMPFEGKDGPHDVTWYTPVPTTMLPNDDLDLQVLWALVLDRMEQPRVDRHALAAAWRDHVGFPWDEYGVAIRNIRLGLRPPLTGSYDNWFINGMGAAIRTEIWACLAPGNPELAAAYAYEDACVDHADEGIWAAVFLAALESAAFVESDPNRLLNTASSHLPQSSLVRQAVADVRGLWLQSSGKASPSGGRALPSGDWRSVREQVLQRYGHENFTDVTMNIAFTVLAYLAGEGDFSRSICIATNCGKDTDCTAATVGALMGILDPDGIPARWIQPIGRTLVLNRQIRGVNPPATLDGFTDLIVGLRNRLDGKPPQPQDISRPEGEALLPEGEALRTVEHLGYTVQAGFTSTWPEEGGPAPQVPAPVRPLRLPGAMAEMPREAFADEVLILRYALQMPEVRRVRIMFNTHQPCTVWVDGFCRFGREGGRMAPSFHRVPMNQSIDLELAAGRHEVIAAIRRPEIGSAQWVFGVADAASHQWLTSVVRDAATPTP